MCLFSLSDSKSECTVCEGVEQNNILNLVFSFYGHLASLETNGGKDRF